MVDEFVGHGERPPFRRRMLILLQHGELFTKRLLYAPNLLCAKIVVTHGIAFLNREKFLPFLNARSGLAKPKNLAHQ
jgi:hypothetical protein